MVCSSFREIFAIELRTGELREGRKRKRTSPLTPITVLCVDNHDFIREGIASAPREESDMELVAQAAKTGNNGGESHYGSLESSLYMAD